MRPSKSDQRHTHSGAGHATSGLARLVERVGEKMSIRQKLLSFAGLSLSLLLVLVAVVLVANFLVQRGGALKDELYSLVATIEELRVTEKRWLQFHTQELRSQADSQLGAVRARLENREELLGLAEDGRSYQGAFGATVAAHGERVAAGEAMAKTLYFADLAVGTLRDLLDSIKSEREMDGKDLAANERALLGVVLESKILLLRLQTAQQGFLLTGDEKQLAEFDRLVQGPSFLTLEAMHRLASAIGSDDAVRASKEARAQVERVMGQGKQVQALFKKESQTIDELDASGKKLIASAERVLAEADRTLARTRAIAFAVMAVLVLSGVVMFMVIASVLVRMITEPIGRLVRSAQGMSAGDLDEAVDIRSRDELGQLGAAFKTMADSQREMASVAAAVARGDVSSDVRLRSSRDVLAGALQAMVEAIRRLVADAGALGKAAVAGDLGKRADAGKHQGDFARIIQGVNSALDATAAPIQEAAGVLEKLAQRDLRARMRGSYQGDHRRIKDWLNSTGAALESALSQVAGSAGEVLSASSQIASSSQAVARGASEQASASQETNAGLASMASMTKQSVSHAREANELVTRAKSATAEGSAAMEQMQGAMGRIRASSEGTSAIIKDINEIAFQTNLLALNAAVEAARAGEAGRGFAVVAGEVRSLALRSKEAASKTEELIRRSVKEAEAGAVTSKSVKVKLSEIGQSIERVTAIVSQIAATAKEQAAGIEQVSRALLEMDKVAQHNAASSEESSSAAEELSSQAKELADLVASFQLEVGVGPLAASGDEGPCGLLPYPESPRAFPHETRYR